MYSQINFSYDFFKLSKLEIIEASISNFSNTFKAFCTSLIVNSMPPMRKKADQLSIYTLFLARI